MTLPEIAALRMGILLILISFFAVAFIGACYLALTMNRRLKKKGTEWEIVDLYELSPAERLVVSICKGDRFASGKIYGYRIKSKSGFEVGSKRVLGRGLMEKYGLKEEHFFNQLLFESDIRKLMKYFKVESVKGLLGKKFRAPYDYKAFSDLLKRI